MRKTRLFLLFVCAAAQAATNPQLGDGREIMSGTGTLNSGVFVRFRSLLTPASSPDQLGEGGISTAADTIHRIMIDRGRGVYFGYDLAIAPGASGDYIATFRALSQPGEPSLKPLAPPKFPAPQTVRDGDIIALDLMVSPDGFRRLTDYIQILAHEPEPPGATATGEPRDFTLDDGPVTFDLSHVAILTNGQKWQAGAGATVRPGATYWLALPEQGRFVLSLVSHAGFTRSGTVRGNVMTFQQGGQAYEIRFMQPVAGAGKVWNLFVLHDRAYQAKPGQRGMAQSGTDRLENLLPSH